MRCLWKHNSTFMSIELKCNRCPIFVQVKTPLISCSNTISFPMKQGSELALLSLFPLSKKPTLVKLRMSDWLLSWHFFSFMPQLTPTDTAHSSLCALPVGLGDCHPSASLSLSLSYLVVVKWLLSKEVVRWPRVWLISKTTLYWRLSLWEIVSLSNDYSESHFLIFWSQYFDPSRPSRSAGFAVHR